MQLFMFSHKNSLVLVTITGIALAVAGGALFAQTLRGNASVGTLKGSDLVVFTSSDGFFPEQLSIVVGGTVVFRNDSEGAFWPASDAHPTHTYYPGSDIENCGTEKAATIFDACEPIESGSSWSFTFTEPGSWYFHDHLNSAFSGVVRVGEGAVLDPSLEVAEYCGQDVVSQRCLDARVRRAVFEDGVGAAYAILKEEFEKGGVAPNCHWTAHIIGGAAYELFSSGKEVPISIESSYCGYGFYHEFFEHALRENPDISFALSFCDRMEEVLGRLGRWNCYHGIGHGYTEDPPPPSQWGNFEAMVEPGIGICEQIFPDSFRDRNLCLTGVFTVPAGFAEESKYGLYLDQEDPFRYCRNLAYVYKKACYGEFAPKLSNLLQGSIGELRSYVDELEDEKLERLVTWVVPSVSVAWVVLKEVPVEPYIETCQRDFDGNLEKVCVGGLVLGLVTHEQPAAQYKRLLEFCSNTVFSEESRALCYSETFRQLRNQSYNEYTEERLEWVCQLAPAQYRQYCTSPLLSPYDDPSFDVEER